MGKIGYLFKRLLDMDYKNMYRTAKRVHQRSGKNTLATLVDMMYCGYRYTAGYMDYDVFEFDRLNKEQRKTYITRGVNNYYVQVLNNRDYWDRFEDKITFNRLFSPYLHRDWIYLKEATADEFAAFLKDKEKVIAKPVDATCGRGILLLEKDQFEHPKELYGRLTMGGQLLVEEFVVQHHEMARIYPGSVNTVRLVTMLVNDQVHLVFSCIRVGNGKYVDNLNSGGMATVIDPETGIINKPAVDKDHNVFNAHPATGTSFIGFQVPFFGESVEMVKQAAKVVPQIGYIGWDVAITEEGPLLIEANHFPGHDIYQFQPHLDHGIGLKPRFDAVLHEKKA